MWGGGGGRGGFHARGGRKCVGRTNKNRKKNLIAIHGTEPSTKCVRGGGWAKKLLKTTVFRRGGGKRMGPTAEGFGKKCGRGGGK